MSIVSVLLAAPGCSTTRNPWATVTHPSMMVADTVEMRAHSGLKARVIGSYSAGCLNVGAVLPAVADGGYQAVREKRNRHYGHPALIRFLIEAGKEARQNGLMLRIADMSQPRGGPMPSGHVSHQTGLDADIWIWQTSQPLVDGENAEAPSAIDARGEQPDRRYWSEASIRALELVVKRPEVERVFINPVLKQDLCVRPERPAWLHKLRPWWGHDRHFHVRLNCPKDEPLCRSAKDPVPPGDGCDATLSWWFSEEARTMGTEAEAKPRKIPDLPAECSAVIASP